MFRELFDKQWDTGSAVSVYHRGQPGVRLTGGLRFSPSGELAAYDNRTIQLVASTTKFGSRIAMYDPRGLALLATAVECARNLSNSQAPVRRIGRESDERVNTRPEPDS